MLAGTPLVLFASAPPEITREFPSRAGIEGTPILSDSGGFQQWLNASFRPRAYLFSRDWQLMWMEKDARSAIYDPAAYNPFLSSDFTAALRGLK
jgi:hypothetical protein